MNLLLQRSPSQNGCTIGQLFIDGVFECYTLEDVIREVPNCSVEQWKVKGETAIPAGEYPIEITHSTRFDKDLPLLLNVTGFSGVRIHCGNTSADTEGCLLVGQKVAPDNRNILNSRLALAQLFPKIQAALDDGENVTITIKNPC